MWGIAAEDASLVPSFSDELCIEEDVRQRPSDEQDVAMVEAAYRYLKVPRKSMMKEWDCIRYLSGI